MAGKLARLWWLPPCTAPKLVTGCLTCRFASQLRGSVVLVDRAAEYLPALHGCIKRQGELRVVIGRPLLAGLVRAMTVVMADVRSEDHPQVPFMVDEHPVGALGACGPHPPLGIAVRPRRPRRSPDNLHALAGEDLVEDASELGIASRMRKRNDVIRSPRSISRLRACRAVQAPSGWAVTPRTYTRRVATSMTNSTYRR